MTHLLAGLLRLGDPVLIGLILLEAVAGSTLALCFLRQPHGTSRIVMRRVALFGLLVTLTAWSVFKTALHASFPTVPLNVPLAWTAPALALCFTTAAAVAFNQARGRPSARNAMLSGSLVASGVSCMLFTAMAGLVQPFAIAYDLTAVLTTTVVASALFILAFWERVTAEHRHSPTLALLLAALAMVVSCLGSLSSILPFDGWMTTLAEPDNLSSTPLIIVVASEAMVVLALSLFGALTDHRVAARDKLETERLRELAGSTFEAIVIHRDGVVLDGNDVLLELTGQLLSELVEGPVAELCRNGDPLQIFEPNSDRLPRLAHLCGPGGELIPVEVLSRPISYAGQPAIASALRDVRERRASEARIRFLAHHDVLTELPNRALLSDTLTRILQECAAKGTEFSVLCLDLDGFKSVNDTLGHAAGDKLLCEVAARLRANVRTGDFIARLGGDEFVVLTLRMPQHMQTAALAQRLVDHISEPYILDDHEMRIGTSIGIATFPRDGDQAETLLQHADLTLYRVKQEGRGAYCFYEQEFGKAIHAQSELEQALKGALERAEFLLHYQPLFDSSRRLISFEALLRWTHPTLGEVSPALFIPIAEKSGLIFALGQWALREACLMALGWRGNYSVAVNVSPRQLLRGDFAEVVSSILKETGLLSSRLELEITESAIVTDSESMQIVLRDLHALGVRLALDDFGTGYSSLSYLHQFAFNKLKVDQSFVKRLETDESARSIVRAIAAMSRSLGLEVTAEGVETIEQLTILHNEGCHEYQGYLLGRPMPATSVQDFIAAHNTCPSTNRLVYSI